MADDNCLADDDKKWKSELRPTGGEFKSDGKIKITKESNQLKGKHEDSGNDLEDLRCDGTNISFNRKGKRPDGTPIRVFYKNGVISGPSGGKFRITGGTYTEEVIKDAADLSVKSAHGESEANAEADPPDPPESDTGDWKAERPTAG
jgi:hypothetical protein